MPKIIINEFYRGGSLTVTDEFIELLILEDLTADQLNSFFVGDSTGTKASKFSAYDFTNTGTIASVFEAGTILTIGGSTAVTQNTSYNPAAGDWNIALNAGGAFLPNANSGSNGDIAGDDVVWIDTANTGSTISADGFAVDIGTGVGAFTAAANVNFGTSTNNTGYALNTDVSGATNIANWSTGIAFASTTPGLPNGGDNTTYIEGLRGSTPAALTIAASPNTFSEAAGANAAVGTVTRSGDLTNPLTVTLSSSDTSEAAVPTTVTILANEATATFNIAAVDDAIVDGTQPISLTATATGFASASTSLTVTDDEVAPIVRIRDIQGASHTSPLNGQTVTGVAGIVTVVRTNGFYLQDPNPDSSDATSEGIFVFTSSAPTVKVGDAIQVSGTVSEFRAGAATGNNLSTTQIISPTINVVSSGNALPTATILGNGGRTIPTSVINDDGTGNVETSGTFDPATDGIDFYESLEGMLVQVNNPLATSPTATFGTSTAATQEIWVLADNGANATSRTARGGSLINANDFNPERIQIDDLNNALVLPEVNVGTQLSTITGVVNYDFSNYEVLVSTAPTVVQASPLQKEVTNLAPTTDQLTVATFNVENLDPGDGAAKFNALAAAIVNNLKAPDIISLEEIQDNNGPTNDSVVDASLTFQTLISAIAAAGGPTYEFRQINPVDDTNGGEPGGNIRVGFLFNPNRVSFVDRPGGTSTSNTTVTDSNKDGIAELSASPGLIDPTNAAFNSSRKPLVGEFLFNDQTVFVIGNHFNSKGGDQPLFGRFQPPTLSSEAQRLQQAEIVRSFVADLLATDPNANVVVAGDLNDFEFSNPVNLIESAGLTNLIETLPANERYTYNFEGNAQTLDYILASQNLVKNLDGFDVVHINSEFADQISDHDPSVARFTIAPINDAPVNTVPGNQTAIQDAVLVFSAATGNAISISDVDAKGAEVQVNLTVTNGALTLNGTSGLTLVNGSNNAAALTVRGTLSNLNTALEKLQFTPDAAAVINGSVTFTLITDDLGNTGTGGAKTDSDTVSIAVNPANLISGNADNNTFQGTAGADTIYGQAGNDKLYGNGGNDIILGGLGNDTIEVGSGINFIDGGAGNDSISLAGGQDTIVLARGNGNDTITNYQAGSTRFNLSAGLTFNSLTIIQDGSSTSIRAGSDKLASLSGVQATSVTANSFITA